MRDWPTLFSAAAVLQCTIDLQAQGWNDPQPLARHAKANNVDTSGISRGISIMEVQVSKTTCSLGEVNHFDTHANDGSAAMVTYLNALPSGDTMYVGVTRDETCFRIHTEGGSAALISAFGVDVSGCDNRASFAFIAKKGDPSFSTTVRKASGAGGSSMIIKLSCEYGNIMS